VTLKTGRSRRAREPAALGGSTRLAIIHFAVDSFAFQWG